MTVKSKITKRIIIRTVIMLLVAAALIAIYVAYYGRLKNARFGIFAIPFFLLVYVLILRKSKLLHLIFDKDWEGKVINSNVIVDYEPITFWVAARRLPPQQILYTIITVEKKNGEVVKLKVESNKIAESVFRPNDILKHYKGAKYPQNVTRSEEIFICPVCGRSLNCTDCPDCHVKFAATPRQYDPYYDWWKTN